MKRVYAGVVLAAGVMMLSLSGCATVKGTVTPMEEGEYKSFVSSNTKGSAMKMANNDAKVTCKKKSKGKFSVVSQEVEQKGPKELETGNSLLDKAISISSIGDQTRSKQTYDITTIFKCQ